MIHTDIPLNGRFEIATFKQSVGSLYRQILAYSGTVPDGIKIKNLLHKAIAIDGLPGTGKTTKIANSVKKGDLVIAMTSFAL